MKIFKFLLYAELPSKFEFISLSITQIPCQHSQKPKYAVFQKHMLNSHYSAQTLKILDILEFVPLKFICVIGWFI